MYTRMLQVWPVSERDLRILKGPRPGKREGQTSQEVHRGSLSVNLNPSANPVSLFADYVHFPDRTGDTPQGKGRRSRVLYGGRSK